MIAKLEIFFDGEQFTLRATAETDRKVEAYDLFRRALPDLARGTTLAQTFGVSPDAAASVSSPQEPFTGVVVAGPETIQ